MRKTLGLLASAVVLLTSLTAQAADDNAALRPVTLNPADGKTVKVIKCYPNGLMRAYCPNFDDGRLEYDSYILETLRSRKMKGTFFVNTLHEQSQKAMQEPQAYEGFEVASHGAHHKGLKGMKLEVAGEEIAADIKNIKERFNQKVEGFAYPYGAIPDDPTEVETMMAEQGIIYARGTRSNGRYLPPENFLRWDPDAPMGSDFPKHWDKFLQQPADEEARVLMHFGHAIDFERGNISKENWEKTLDRIAADKTIWNPTLLEFAHYIIALRAVKVAEQGIQNPSAIAVWVKVNDKPVELKPESSLSWGDLK